MQAQSSSWTLLSRYHQTTLIYQSHQWTQQYSWACRSIVAQFSPAQDKHHPQTQDRLPEDHHQRQLRADKTLDLQARAIVVDVRSLSWGNLSRTPLDASLGATTSSASHVGHVVTHSQQQSFMFSTTRLTASAITTSSTGPSAVAATVASKANIWKLMDAENSIHDASLAIPVEWSSATIITKSLGRSTAIDMREVLQTHHRTT